MYYHNVPHYAGMTELSQVSTFWISSEQRVVSGCRENLKGCVLRSKHCLLMASVCWIQSNHKWCTNLRHTKSGTVKIKITRLVSFTVFTTTLIHSPPVWLVWPQTLQLAVTVEQGAGLWKYRWASQSSSKVRPNGQTVVTYNPICFGSTSKWVRTSKGGATSY